MPGAGNAHRESRLNLVHWYLHEVLGEEIHPTLFMFSGEALFQFGAHMNSQNIKVS